MENIIKILDLLKIQLKNKNKFRIEKIDNFTLKLLLNIYDILEIDDYLIQNLNLLSVSKLKLLAKKIIKSQSVNSKDIILEEKHLPREKAKIIKLILVLIILFNLEENFVQYLKEISLITVKTSKKSKKSIKKRTKKSSSKKKSSKKSLSPSELEEIRKRWLALDNPEDLFEEMNSYPLKELRNIANKWKENIKPTGRKKSDYINAIIKYIKNIHNIIQLGT
ncbi:MAG: hypothetical protein ACTSRZ_18880 [Promethearchaeota archaeon]